MGAHLLVSISLYISGWTVYKLQKRLVKCEECLSALQDNTLEESSITHLLRVQRRGKLVILSRDVIAICLECEKLFRDSAMGNNRLTATLIISKTHIKHCLTQNVTM